MTETSNVYSGPERRKSFWRRLFYPLPERRVSHKFIRSFQRRIAVTLVITIVIALGLSVALDKTLSLLAKKKQRSETNHIVFEINANVVQHFDDALSHLVTSSEVTR